MLAEEKTEFIRDSAIKRFELAFDMAWKAIKAFLEENGVACVSPLSCFREAYRQSLLDYEDIWFEMVKTRNATAHTYKEELAEKVYDQLPPALGAFQKLLSVLKNQQEKWYYGYIIMKNIKLAMLSFKKLWKKYYILEY